MTKEESKHHLELYEHLQSENERLKAESITEYISRLKEVLKHLGKLNESDIDYVYALMKHDLGEEVKAEREWISVEDRLPELERGVWVFAEGEVWLAYYWDFCGRLTYHSQDKELKPTHWMYNDAPQPPKQ